MREFRKTTGRNLRPNIWYIEVNGDTVITRWGLLDGAIQETRDIPGSCGVLGHADYQTPEEYAVFCMERDIRKKKETGYIEYINCKPTEKVINFIDFSKPLPKNLTFCKPKTSISDKKLSAIKHPIWTQKRDGMMHVAVKTDKWEIYSRRMDLATEKFPHIIHSLNLLKVPNNTILLGEIVLLEDGIDNFKAVSRICRSDPDLALSYQGLKKGNIKIGLAKFYVFDIAFYGGEDLIRNKTVGSRIRKLRDIFYQFGNLKIGMGFLSTLETHKKENKIRENMLKKYHIAPLKIFKTSPQADLELAKKIKAEGFVVVDGDAIYGDKGYSFDGKAQRPNGVWKRKPKYEDEFIIVDIYEGSGRNRGKLGGFVLEQYHQDKRISCGKCGGGFTDEHRIEFWDNKKSYIGKTAKIEFDSRQPPKDGAYAVRFPVFKGWSDKTPEECVAQGL